jgi:hypothetical protein
MNLKIPYGESNFKTVITGGYVYVDLIVTDTQRVEVHRLA